MIKVKFVPQGQLSVQMYLAFYNFSFIRENMTIIITNMI